MGWGHTPAVTSLGEGMGAPGGLGPLLGARALGTSSRHTFWPVPPAQ